ncbi:MAG: DUF3617 domain-containing protein [Caulobacterales bacterium]
MTRIVLFLALVAALAACHRAEMAGAGAGASTALPVRRAGLWAQTITSDRPTPLPRFELCLDAASDRRVSIFGRQFRRGACDRYVIWRAADGAYVADSVCRMGSEGAVTSHVVVRGDLRTRYEVTSQRTVVGAPAAAANGRHMMVISATFEGACPVGMQPGQVLLPDGNITDPEAPQSGSSPPTPPAR